MAVQSDVLLVLAGGLTDAGQLPKLVEERITFAYQLWKKNTRTAIIFSGGWGNFWEHVPPTKTEAVLMAQFALRLGIPKSVIQLEEYSHNTFENIFYSNKLYIEPHGWQRIAIITSDFHANRVNKLAQRIFTERCDITVYGIPTQASFSKRLRWFCKERILLSSDWFMQHFGNR